MEEVTLQKDTLAIAEKNLLAYFNTHDVRYVTEDAVFKSLNTGEVYTGREEIGAMLHYIYHVAFDARAEMTSYIVTESKAQVEGWFVGTHTGEFAGIPATGKSVRVPLCVTYDLRDGLIQEGRIFMLADVMMQQLGAGTGAVPQKTTFVVRDIFQLKFGHYRDAKKLLDEAAEQQMLPESEQIRVLTDFTGDAYRLVFEEGFNSLADYEISLTSSMKAEAWQRWYERFKIHVERSHREILKQVM